MMRRWIALLALAGCPHKTAPPPPAPTEATDFAQADMMLGVLAAKPATTAQLDAVMALPGTQLIVQQQNLARRITADQYRTVLAAYAADAAPTLAPTDDSERAARGVDGLRNDVWPALHWGASHTDDVGTRLAALRKIDFSASGKLAVEWLPDGKLPSVKLHVVAGGRAGAAAIDRDIYFDVLATAYKANAGALSAYPNETEIVEMFAHETHHIGLAEYSQKRRAQLQLDEPAGRAYDLLATIVAEGTATYFINAHHSLVQMQSNPQYADHFADPDKLLATIERLLDDTINHGMSADTFDKGTTPLVESGFHVAGAIMLDAIYRTDGKKSIVAVMRDPRALLVEYNTAAVALSGRGEMLRPFDGAITERVAHLGGP
jgi:hypothetical protein